ncbi:MAG: matrixin family metalloprotease [Candidatus Paceibacterota bacterium]
MNNSTLNKILIFLIVIAFAGNAYIFRNEINYYLPILGTQKPCEQPITYSIGTLDQRFGISEQEFLEIIEQATSAWSESIDRELFTYDPQNGKLKISLLYDYRQDSTDRLKSLGITINNNLSGYETLKAKYDSAIIAYNQQNAQIEAREKSYNENLSAYNSQVNYWNSKGGAPQAKVKELEKEKTALENERKTIIQFNSQLKSQIDNINAMATALNQMAADLNINANLYNGIVANQEEEFQEGHYRENSLIQEINIYQFNDRNMLTRVLMHELGHALGLGHLENPEAIMYRLNQATNLYLTEDDLSALKQVCKIK